MRGLIGAPVVDIDEKLVGIVLNSEFNLFTMDKMFAPVGTVDLKAFLNNCSNN
jgi:hypothetical protein